MLRIPHQGDVTPPLVAPLQQVDFPEDSTAPVLEKRTRSKRKKKLKEAETPGWDASAGKWKSRKSGGSHFVKTLILWLAGMAAVVGAVVFYVKLTDAEKSSPDAAGTTGKDGSEELVRSTALVLPDVKPEDPVALPKVMERSESEFLERAEPLAKTFLEADNIDEMLKVVYDAERVSGLIRKHYPGGKIEPKGISVFNVGDKVSYKDSFAAVGVTTPDYVTRQLAFIDGEDGLKIDWESWVGWSEMPWDEMLEKRPQKPVLVRATLKWVDYFNFGFSDEGEWRSYRLVSPDGETTLYGYAERNSLLDQRLRPGELNATVAVTLKIRFREDEQAPDQVVIEEYVSDGWVVVPEK